jgi:aldose 1-epimerase
MSSAPELADRKFRHGLVGRYVNLLPAEVPLQLPSGESMTLPSFPAKGGSLHGGPSPFGWDEKILSKVEFDCATLFSPKETEYLNANSAGIWSLTSPDGEGGHIGTVYCEIAMVTLASTSPGELGQFIVIYRAKVMDKPSTALNLTHHWGFNLGASSIAKGEPTPANDIAIQNHVLTLRSSEILNIDPATSRPTGTTLSLSTPSAELKDFRNGKTIGKVGDGYPTSTGKLGQGSSADGYCDYWIFDRQARSVVFEESDIDQVNVFDDIAEE